MWQPKKKSTMLLLLEHYGVHVRFELFTTVGMQENLSVSS